METSESAFDSLDDTAQSSTAASTVILPADKYGALLDSYSRKSKEHAVLRAAVVRTRGEAALLVAQLSAAQAAAETRERDLRAYADEVDRLAALHDTATKRIAVLQVRPGGVAHAASVSVCHL